MTRWRLGLALILVIAIGVPLALPFASLVRYPSSWTAWQEGERLGWLGWNTCLLVVGTIAWTVPLGVAIAVVLIRSDLPHARTLWHIVILSLFIPLPLYASAWQATLGTGGWLPVAVWRTVPEDDPDYLPSGIVWKPWARGLGPAILVQGSAALPWVILIVGTALVRVERELEEDALLVIAPARVLWSVSLRRCWPAVAAAALWVGVQSATEITVTDLMQVRSFAEEVYTQFVAPDPGPHGTSVDALVARAVAVSLPSILLFWLFGLALLRSWGRSHSPLFLGGPRLALCRFGPWRWPGFAVVALIAAVWVSVPMGSLLWKAGLGGSPEAWEAQRLGRNLVLVATVHGSMILRSLALAISTGVVAGSLALIACWLARESRWLFDLVLGLGVLSWASPGPVIGIGLKDAIDVLIDLEAHLGWESGPLRQALYTGPSLLPLLWVGLVRYFPYAALMLWPSVRSLPPEFIDSARVDGASPAQELGFVVAPLCFTAWARAVLAVAVLSLGEISAGKLVKTPGAETFAQELFSQMHYSVTNNVAALCLVLLAVVGGGGLVWMLLARIRGER